MYDPDNFRKASATTQNSDDFSRRIPHVDALQANREKKFIFDKVEADDQYFPFGSQGR